MTMLPPEGGFPRRIDAIIFGDDGTVTVEYDTPKPDGHPGVLRGGRRTVSYDLSDEVQDNYMTIMGAACDLVAAIEVADRQPPTRITGGPPA